jgi:hypothetical protein
MPRQRNTASGKDQIMEVGMPGAREIERMALTIGREVQEMADAARRRGEFVRSGAVTPSGWRVLARALLSDNVGERQDLWAVQAPDPAGRVSCFATGAFLLLPRPYSWREVERLLEVCQARVVETQALMAAARAVDPQVGEGALADGDGQRVVEADWMRPSRRGEEQRGTARLRMFDAQPVAVEGAALHGPASAEAQLTGVRALRVGTPAQAFDARSDADDLLARSVWIRPLTDSGESQVWRRGRLRLEPDRAVFIDEPDAEDGTPGELPEAHRASAATALEADLHANPTVGGKLRSGGVYAALLAAALRGTSWRRNHDGARAGRGRPVSALLARIAGEEDNHPSGGELDGVLDEVVVADLHALGWEPAR